MAFTPFPPKGKRPAMKGAPSGATRRTEAQETGRPFKKGGSVKCMAKGGSVRGLGASKKSAAGKGPWG